MTDKLELLRKPLQDMTDDELIDRLAHIRKDRTTSKHHEKARAKNEKKASDKLSQLLDGMDPEKIRELLA